VIDGRLDWREYDAQDGSKHQAVQIIADTVQFLASPDRRTHDDPPRPALGHSAPADDDDIPS
jgi:single-stranded DNA-binding protein